MAAYAAVVSVINTMDAVMNVPRFSSCFDQKQIHSLGEKLGVLLHFIENYNSLGRDEEVESLERRISSAAHAAEDVIERHIVDQIHAGVLEKKAPTFMIDLQQTIQNIDLVKQEVVKVEEESGTSDVQPKYSTSSASVLQPPLITTGKKTTMVGFDDYLLQLLDGLTGHESGRLVIPVVGMGGVGKTTLTRNAYENPLTVQHFDVRAWVSISQQYNVKNILIQLLSNIEQSTEGNNEGELSECLYKYLFGRRYLIVLDDMWSITAWDKIKFCFPENFNGSRIIVSTRLLEVANDLASSRIVRVGLLDECKSWDLFCMKAFAQHDECCPAELEQVGKRIVKKCNGLPLSIVVIGAFLGKSSRDTEYWEKISSSILSSSEEGNECLDILCLSYHNLPAHLKPCFLYLGIFREDHEIIVSQLIKLWVSEGFIKPDKDQWSLEEVAEGYVDDLFERSLILVDSDSLRCNIKLETFLIHDIVRELCLREAQKEKFMCVVEALDQPVGLESERCIVVSGGVVQKHGRSFCNLSVARSVICEWEGEPTFTGSTLLRVLLMGNVDVDSDDIHIVKSFEQVNLRAIASVLLEISPFSKNNVVGGLPRSISQLWNLQTLIFSHTKLKSEAPVEIWRLPQLRHVEFRSIRLPEPPPRSHDDKEFALHNLQTLKEVRDMRFSEEVCKRIPNIKRLGLCYKKVISNDECCLQNVGLLSKLESLSYSSRKVTDNLVQNLLLPASLKELSLSQCRLHWDDDMMRTIGTLPHLQVLKLWADAFVGSEWECVEGEFLRLKYLGISGCRDLRKWNAESSHFPVLETLVLDHFFEFEEIPSRVGDIATLTCIRVDRCWISLAVSAMKVLEEQESLGNDALQIQHQFWDRRRQKEFMERVEREGITCSNFTMTTVSWK